MTDEQILELIMKGATCDAALTDLVGRYAQQLAAMSDRIYPGDMDRLIGIGSALYQLALRDFEAGADAQEILTAIQDRRERD